MEPRVPNYDPLVPLHNLGNYKLDIGQFLCWANTEGYHAVYNVGVTGFRVSTINAFQEWVGKQVPHKFESQISAIKFLREMVADKRDGLKDCKEFVDAVFRTPKPTNFVN